MRLLCSHLNHHRKFAPLHLVPTALTWKMHPMIQFASQLPSSWFPPDQRTESIVLKYGRVAWPTCRLRYS
eukprot:4255950-Pleurochrysis_carterae.AAC.1